MSERIGRCTGAHCHALIHWGEISGRPHPFDTKPCKKCNQTGKLSAQSADMFAATPATVFSRCPKCKGKGYTVGSHFTTCPDAPKFRRKEDA